MAVVVDASAIAAIAFGEPGGAELETYLVDETLLAPTLLDFELSNIALKKARRHPQYRDQIAAALAAALSLPIARVPVPGVEALSLAITAGLSAYDASYLWLAQSRNVELVSLDEPLLRAWEHLQR